MDEKELQELIHSLKDLQIKEQEIKRRQSEIIEQIEQLSIAQDNDKKQPSEDIPASAHDWKIGDRVYITNKVTVPSAFRKANEGDRYATIRELKFNAYSDRISITTDNGQKTWRISDNLSWISRKRPDQK